MSEQRARAQEQLPTVLLGVLGILQALVLEMLWVDGLGGLDRWQAIGAWGTGVLQAVAVFLGVVVVWLMYSSLVLRFTWVPRFHDLIAPFVIGVLEFGLVGLTSPDRAGSFLLLLAVVFVVAAGTNYGIYITIRESPGAPERLLSNPAEGYVPSVATVAWLVVTAPLVGLAGADSWLAWLAMLGACAGLIAQVNVFWQFWQSSFRD